LVDEIDLKILDILQSSGRIKRNDLAETVGLSIPSVSDRLKKLEESGYITGYHAHVDPKKLGKDVTAFIAVIIDSSRRYPSFIEHAHHADDILECHAVTGEGSYLLKIRTENTTSLEKLLAKIQSWPGVMGTRTQLVLSSPKESTQIKLPIHK
jgi:Lrp/AsnC family transcriptional regulator, leucine-responsive regulatory protein